MKDETPTDDLAAQLDQTRRNNAPTRRPGYRSPDQLAAELRLARKTNRKTRPVRGRMPAPALSRRTGSTRPTWWPRKVTA